MRTVSVINLKGGVAKTISSVNLAHILSFVHGYKVLLIDNDKQGNASKILDRHSASNNSKERVKGTSEVMTQRGIDPDEVIQHTAYDRLDIVAADMTLLSANLQVLLDQTSPQQTRFRKFIKDLGERYDFVVIDNAPDINISTINALVASDDVLIPITIDEFAIDGLAELNEQVNNTKEDLNPKLELRGCFITQYDRYNEADVAGEAFLQGLPYPMFDTHIRRTPKMKLSTFAHKPIVDFSPKCGASIDYMAFTEEYLNKIGMNLLADGFNSEFRNGVHIATAVSGDDAAAETEDSDDSSEKEDNEVVDWSNHESAIKSTQPVEVNDEEKEIISAIKDYMGVEDDKRIRHKSGDIWLVDGQYEVNCKDALEYVKSHPPISLTDEKINIEDFVPQEKTQDVMSILNEVSTPVEPEFDTTVTAVKEEKVEKHGSSILNDFINSQTDHSENEWKEEDTDEIGGIHGNGTGLNPNGVFCSPCEKTSCLGCERASLTPMQIEEMKQREEVMMSEREERRREREERRRKWESTRSERVANRERIIHSAREGENFPIPNRSGISPIDMQSVNEKNEPSIPKFDTPIVEEDDDDEEKPKVKLPTWRDFIG